MNGSETSVAIDRLLAETRWVHALARRLVVDQSRADDVVQQAYLAALEGSPAGEHERRRWLSGLVRSVAHQLSRADARRRRRERIAARPEALPSTAEVVERVDVQRRLVECVLSLEPLYRDVLVLRYFEELPVEEIARRTNAPRATVRVRLMRARERLRERLDRDHRGDGRSWALALVPLAVQPGGIDEAVLPATLVPATAIGVGLAALAVIGATVVLLLDRGAGGSRGASVVASVASPSASVPADTGFEELAAPDLPPDARATRSGPPPLASGSAAIELDRCCIVGRVAGLAGEAVPGARVEAVEDTPRDPSIVRIEDEAPAVLETQSGEGGIFRLAVPERRSFLLRAHHPSFATALEHRCFAGERRDLQLLPGARFSVVVVSDPGREPVPEAEVGAKTIDESGAPPGWSTSTRADASGVARFERVPAGPIHVWASARGRGKRLLRVDSDGLQERAIEFELQPAASVSGRVLAAESDAPIAGADVRIQEVTSTTSDSDGRFLLEDLTAFRPSGSEPRRGVVAPVTASAPGRTHEVVYVQLDEPGSRVEITLRLAPASRVVGRLTDATGRPRPDGDVAWRGTYGTNPFTTEFHSGRTRSDANGRFALDGIQAGGSYVLVAQAEGSGRTAVSFGPIAGRAAPFDLGDVVLSDAASISGHVEGGPYATGAQGRAGGLVALDRIDAGPERRAIPFGAARVDPRGEFAFDGLSAGTYRVRLMPWDAGKSRHADAPVAVAALELGPGERLSGLRLALEPAIVGRVITRNDQPAARVCIRLRAMDDETAADGRAMLAQAEADEEGRFRIQGFGGGPYLLEVTDPTLTYEPASIEGLAPGADDVTVVVLLRSTSHRIAGSVVDEQGRAVSDVYVHFTDAGTGERLARVALLDEHGRFEMQNLDDKPYHLRIVDFRDRYEAERRDSVRPGGDPVDFRLRNRR